MGSCIDFVDCNNFIIFEYCEKDLLDVMLWLKVDVIDEYLECVIEDMFEVVVGLEKCKWMVNVLINYYYKIIFVFWQVKNNVVCILVMLVVKVDVLIEGNNNSWNLVFFVWVNVDVEEQCIVLNIWKVCMMLEDEKGNKQNFGVVEIIVQQDCKIELIVDNIVDIDCSDYSYEVSVLVDGEDGVVMDFLIIDFFGDFMDCNGNELVDDVMMFVLYDSNDKKVILVQMFCIMEIFCVFIVSCDKEVGMVMFFSILLGIFCWKVKEDVYGDSNYVDVIFIGDNLSVLNVVIYQVKVVNFVNLIGKEDKYFMVNNIYCFLLWCDKNKDGVFQMFEQFMEEQMVLYDYQWEFIGQSINGYIGVLVNIINEDFVLLVINKEVVQKFVVNVEDGVQGYGICVMYSQKQCQCCG